MLGAGLEQPDRHHVVVADGRGRAGLGRQETLAGGVPALERHRVPEDQRALGTEPGASKGGPVPVLAVADPRVAPRRDDQRDPTVPQTGEVRHHLGGGGRPVDPHRRDAGPLHLAVQEHHRDVGALRHLGQVLGRALGRAEDEPVRAALEQVRDVPPLALGIPPAAGEDQAVARRGELVLGPARHVREEGARDVAHDEADRLGLPADQAAGDVARVEPELRDRLLHPRAGQRGDVILAVDEAGHRLVGHAGDPGDVPDGHSLPRSGWAHRWAPIRVTGHTLASRSGQCQSAGRCRARRPGRRSRRRRLAGGGHWTTPGPVLDS